MRITRLDLLIVCVLLIPGANSQFPRICADNATSPDGVCCPTPPGSSSPCGGPGRGKCVILENSDEDFSPELPQNKLDDRLDWPRTFFQSVCECEGTYMGYMCQECQFGFIGSDCTQKKTLIRKNALSLTPDERTHFRNTVNRAKYTLSEYVVMDNTEDVDPITTPIFINASVYDYIVYLHVYAARFTLQNHTLDCESSDFPNPNSPYYDVAHEGPAFLTWHRLYLLHMERELQKVSGDDQFALPYWDWIDAGTTCDVCTNDLVGATNTSDPIGLLENTSPFSTWYQFCQEEAEMNGCRACRASQPGLPLRRVPGGTIFGHLPTREETEYTMSRVVYDEPNYNAFNDDSTFRVLLEGFVSQNGSSYLNKTFFMHNLVHGFFNGTMYPVPISANDPLFILHHTFVDKLFEIWLRKTKTHVTAFPASGAPLGHNQHSPMVPFFPRHINAWYFVDSRTLGYEFDTMDLSITDTSVTIHPAWIALMIMAVVFIFVLSGAIVCFERINKTKQTQKQPPPMDTTSGAPGDKEDKDRASTENTPLLESNMEEDQEDENVGFDKKPKPVDV